MLCFRLFYNLLFHEISAEARLSGAWTDHDLVNGNKMAHVIAVHLSHLCLIAICVWQRWTRLKLSNCMYVSVAISNPIANICGRCSNATFSQLPIFEQILGEPSEWDGECLTPMWPCDRISLTRNQ